MDVLKKQKIIDIATGILEFLFLLVIILECNSVARNICGDATVVLWIFLADGLCFLLILMLMVKERMTSFLLTGDKPDFGRQALAVLKEYLPLLICNVIFISVFYLLNTPNVSWKKYAAVAFVFMNGMTVLFRLYYRQNKILRLFCGMEKILLFLTVSSLILWFAVTVLKLPLNGHYVKIDWWGGSTDYYGFLNLYFFRSVGSSKNLSIFVEPPMFGLMLVSGLCTELFLKKRADIRIILVFLLGLFSCRAVLAIMIAVIALFFKLAEYIRNWKYGKVMTVLAVAASIVCIVFLYRYKMKAGYGSLMTHLDDFTAAFECWKDHPVFGCGFANETPIEAYMSEWRLNNRGLSNSAGVVLAEGGVVLFLFYLLPFVILCSRWLKVNRKLAYWSICMFLAFALIIFYNRLYIFFLLAFGYSLADLSFHKKRPYIRLKIRAVEENTEAKEDRP